MKHKRAGRSARASPRAPSVLDVDVAGINCGAAEHYVAVPPDRDPRPSNPSPPTSSASPTGSSTGFCSIRRSRARHQGSSRRRDRQHPRPRGDRDSTLRSVRRLC